MKISVIIPTYKPNYYIWKCLDSAKEQTLNKELFEVLIILNGEKEPYYKKILNYIEENRLKNFKLLYTEERGVSNARNLGLEICKGEYIAFIDDDDYLSKNYLEGLLEQAEKETLVVSNGTYFEDETNIEREKPWKYIEELNSDSILKNRKYFSVVWAKLIPLNIIKKIKFKKELANGEDSLFMVEISKNIKKIKSSSKTSIYFRRLRKNSANFKKRDRKEIFSSFYIQIFYLMKLLKDKKYNKIFILIKCLATLKSLIVAILR